MNQFITKKEEQKNLRKMMKDKLASNKEKQREKKNTSLAKKIIVLVSMVRIARQDPNMLNKKEFKPSGNHHLMESKKFSLDTLSSNDFFFIQLDDHNRLHSKLKTQYIYNILQKYKGDILEMKTFNQYNITDYFTFEILNEANHTFAEGIIPVHILQKTSYEGFKANVKLKHFENWTRMDTAEDKEEIPDSMTTEETITLTPVPISSTSTVRRQLQGIALEPKGGLFVETTYFMSSWLIPDYARVLFSLIAIVLKALVTLLQFFLVFIRPCITNPKTLLHDWTISFASTMMWIQSYLFLGLLSQNFGGALNHPVNEMMRTSRSIFSERFDKKYLEEIFNADKKYKGAGYWDLAINGYIPSPILENWVGSIILPLTLIGVVVLKKNKYRRASIHNDSSTRLYTIMKEAQIGSLLSFMVPLNVSSINCIFATFDSGIFDVMGVISFLFSLFIIGYYLFFIFELCRKNPFKRAHRRYYSHLNFDLPQFYAKLLVPYIEYLILYLLVVIETALANEHFLPIAVSIFLQIFLLVILAATPAKTQDFSEISRINLWKKINIFLKTLLLVVILIFLYFNDKMSLQFVKIFTIFSLFLMFIVFIGYLYVLLQRLLGTARRGMGDRYAELESRSPANSYRVMSDRDFELDHLPSRKKKFFQSQSRGVDTGFSLRQKSGYSDFDNIKNEYMSDFKRSRKGRFSNASRVSKPRKSLNGWDDWDYDYARYLERSEARSNGGRRSRTRGSRHHGYMHFDADF